MEPHGLKWITALALLTAMLAPVHLGAQDSHNPTRYVVFDLGTLGGANAGGNSINNRTWVAGTSTLDGNQVAHAALWVNGSKIDLGAMGGPNSNSAIAWPVKNEHGIIVGFSETAEVNPLGERFSCPSFFLGVPRTGHSCQGFKWENGTMTALPTLGGFNSYATGINNRGQAVGWAENTVHDPTCVPPRQVLQFRAVIWGRKPNEIQELPPLSGDTSSAATAINDEGQVAGISGICDRAVGRFSAAHAVLWQNGVPTDIGNLGGVAWNTPAAINHLGVIVGFSDLPGDASGAANFHAFVKLPGTPIQDLKALGNDPISGAFGINDRGQIVGQSIDADGFSRAVIWQNGKIADLNTLVPAGSPLLVYANDINERGEIAGQACVVVDGVCVTTSAFLAIPVDDEDDESAASTGSTQKAKLPVSLRRQLEARWGEGFLDRIKP
jgi:probable HAF family extracellular repeat protein